MNSNSNLQRVDELMSQNRWDEAQHLLESVFASDIFQDEMRGRAFLMYTMAYLEALISMNQQYKDTLARCNAFLKKVNQAESEMNEDIELQRLHADIAKLTS